MSVIDEMLGYLMAFVEKPSSIFGKFPVCPFAHKARVDNKIQFVERAFTDEDLNETSEMIRTMKKFAGEETYDLLMFLHPDKKYPFDELMKFIERLQPIANHMGLLVFEGHPDDPFTAGGVRLRAEPTANVQIIRKTTFDAAHTLLTKTKYFDRLTPLEMKQFS